MSDTDDVMVTVVIPARNEARDIARCLHAVAASDWPPGALEVLVIDGGSTDGTGAVAKEQFAAEGTQHGDVLANPRGSTPSSLNIGLAAARGSVLVRVDARSIIPADYVRTCVDVLTQRPEIAVVGGRQWATPRADGVVARGIARGLNNRWGMGFSRYRRGARSGPADTVYLGAFRTADVRAEGGWSERFPTNQDFELNRRLARRGVVWFDDRLVVGYLPRSSVALLAAQYHRFGRWKVRYWRATGDRPRPRQWALILGPLVGAAAVVAAVARRPARWRAVMPLAASAALAVEVAGSRDVPGRDPAEHLVAAAALAATSGGWLTGVLREALRRSPRGSELLDPAPGDEHPPAGQHGIDRAG